MEQLDGNVMILLQLIQAIGSLCIFLGYRVKITGICLKQKLFFVGNPIIRFSTDPEDFIGRKQLWTAIQKILKPSFE